MMLDELTLAKCVDGELTEDEQREFLKLVEQTGEWKSLALTFLEEQAWSNVMSQPPLVQKSTGNVQTATVVPEPSARRKNFSLSTMALSLLVAMAAGLLIGDIWRDHRQPGTQNVTVHKPILEQDNSHGQVATMQTGRDAVASQSPTPVSKYVLTVRDQDGNVRQIARPVYSPADYSPTQAGLQITPDVEQQLLEMGWQIQRERRARTMQMEDGRRIVVPVQRIQAMPFQ